VGHSDILRQFAGCIKAEDNTVELKENNSFVFPEGCPAELFNIPGFHIREVVNTEGQESERLFHSLRIG